MVVGSSPTQGSQFFFEKINDCFRRVCVALPFCCVVVALSFSASLELRIVHDRLLRNQQ